MSEIGIGLPNQAARALVSTFSVDVNQQEPFERVAQNTSVTTEVDAIAAELIPANRKVSIRDIYITSTQVNSTIRVYRGSTVILRYDNVALGVTERVPLEEGIEYDENESFRVTVASGTGATVDVNIVGRSELKRNERFSQVIA